MKISKRGVAFVLTAALSLTVLVPSFAAVYHDDQGRLVVTGEDADALDERLSSIIDNFAVEAAAMGFGSGSTNSSASSGSGSSGSSVARSSGSSLSPDTPGTWVLTADNIWNFVAPSGYRMQNSWVTSGNYTYYLGNDGSMQTGWKQIDGKWYYFTESSSDTQPVGSMYVSRYTPDGYYVGSNGAWQ